MIIKFNPIATGFNPDLNVTVRDCQPRYQGLKIGDTIVLSDLGPMVLGYGIVERIYHGPMKHIPKSFLKVEHSPACRTLRGLKKTMTHVYGQCFHMHRTVTAIMFTYREKV